MAVVGVIARPHGIRGQVVITPLTDFPEDRFAVGAELFAQVHGAVQPVRITSLRFQQDRPVLGIEGVTDRTAAEAWAGRELRVPHEALRPLPEGRWYQHDLVGLAMVSVDGTPIGTVTAVDGRPGGFLLAVDSPQGEVLVPLVDAICREVDLAQRRVVVALPDGLLELNRARDIRAV